MKDLLSIYPVVIDIPISWGDMDAFQHVNNTVYFKFFESARIAYFEKLHVMDVMSTTGVGPILAATKCRFKIPLTYPDTVSVGAKVDAIEQERFIMTYAVISHRHKKIAATGEGEIVTFNYQRNQKAPVPDEVRHRILDLEKT
ncbi:thioesterase [Desulfoluna limicola]|uniref:Thioesterase n=1 Tax=Desulfoluna limicola TaxID=2810562 RepID=A0ABM7PJG9_9BACT|nr:thioesterase family protein [Desulfoluna limicola]BCS97226.1 thioesterase [Desulfoluna limicola]